MGVVAVPLHLADIAIVYRWGCYSTPTLLVDMAVS